MAIPLVLIIKRDVSETRFGAYQTPRSALCDIGNCVDGRENCLFEFCRRKGGFVLPTSPNPCFLANLPIFYVLGRDVLNCWRWHLCVFGSQCVIRKCKMPRILTHCPKEGVRSVSLLILGGFAGIPIQVFPKFNFVTNLKYEDGSWVTYFKDELHVTDPDTVYIPKTTRANVNKPGEKRRRVETDDDFYARVWERELSSEDEEREERDVEFRPTDIQNEACPNFDAMLSDSEVEEGDEYVGIICQQVDISLGKFLSLWDFNLFGC